MTAEALRLEAVSKSFGGLPAVRGVSLSIADGERRLLLGPNGAGKTTLFNLVTGDLPPDTGSIPCSAARSRAWLPTGACTSGSRAPTR